MIFPISNRVFGVIIVVVSSHLIETCILTMYTIITVIFWYRGEVTTRSVHTQEFTESTYPVNDVIAF